MEIAILIGGKGSRVKKISKKIPKAFLKIGNYSIIDHQLKQLSKLKKTSTLNLERSFFCFKL